MSFAVEEIDDEEIMHFFCHRELEAYVHCTINGAGLSLFLGLGHKALDQD